VWPIDDWARPCDVGPAPLGGNHRGLSSDVRSMTSAVRFGEVQVSATGGVISNRTVANRTHVSVPTFSTLPEGYVRLLTVVVIPTCPA
jgi:hypothetical protein